MSGTHSILFVPGDGIGPEVMEEVRRVIDWFARKRNLRVDIEDALIGGACYDAHEVAILNETVEKAKRADVVLLGAVGGPKWQDVPFEQRPEAALLKLRKELDLFANLRPAICFAPMADASSLKRELVEGLDILIVRELTGGIYFGTPRGIEDLGNGEKSAVNTQRYDSWEIRRIAQVAFMLARARRSLVTSVEKRNVMETGILWHEEVTHTHEREYSDVQLEHLLADACAMELVRRPKRFDVILADNLFGDMLSDEAAMLTGSLGMLPSASLGEVDKDGRRAAMYEPVHGSAPDIAGEGVANPIASILGFAMALRYSFARNEDAALLEQAVNDTLEGGVRTADIWQEGCEKVSTSGMGESIVNRLESNAASS
ncbi:MAG: 3-isopropylmalate dehydrogenase [Hyphomicrobiales bacterium]|nr:3-isopropylmalate dehydrogenase [Hyphomicrobiales bacterium]MCY4037853.1 3-isopropylmalate dehydrogenase [Hyphomicrobiales bacterium]